jgi:hypothetical protein
LNIKVFCLRYLREFLRFYMLTAKDTRVELLIFFDFCLCVFAFLYFLLRPDAQLQQNTVSNRRIRGFCLDNLSTLKTKCHISAPTTDERDREYFANHKICAQLLCWANGLLKSLKRIKVHKANIYRQEKKN